MLVDHCQKIINSNSVIRMLHSLQGKEGSQHAAIVYDCFSALHDVSVRVLEERGFVPVQQGSYGGSILYRQSTSGEEIETLDVYISDMSWQFYMLQCCLILSTSSEVKDGDDLWAVKVVGYYDGVEGGEADQIHNEDLREREDIITILDVLSVDDQVGKYDDYTILRHVIVGEMWKGIGSYSSSIIDMSRPPGTSIETWLHATMLGLIGFLTAKRRGMRECKYTERNEGLDSFGREKILIFGLGGTAPLIKSILRYIKRVDILVVEKHQCVIDHIRKYIPLGESSTASVSILHATTDNFIASEEGKGKFSVVLFDAICNNKVSDWMLDAIQPICDQNLASDGCVIMRERLPLNKSTDGDAAYTYRHSIDKVKMVSSHPVLVAAEQSLRAPSPHEVCEDCVIVGSKEGPVDFSLTDWSDVFDNQNILVSMDVGLAQQTSAIKLRNFLSIGEIERLEEVAMLCAARSGLEVRSAGTDAWKVLFLQTNNIFKEELPALYDKIVTAVKDVDAMMFNVMSPSTACNLRVAEYHTQVAPSPGLPDPHHYDMDSMITIDIMLAEPGVDFEGGQFSTLESDGTSKEHFWGKGDAMVFVSHKYHSVSPVTKGVRKVLVLEFWSGRDRQCPHRCESLSSYCKLDKSSYIEEDGDGAVTRPAGESMTVEGEGERGEEKQVIDLPMRLGSSILEDTVVTRVLWQSVSAGGECGEVKLLSRDDEAWDLFE